MTIDLNKYGYSAFYEMPDGNGTAIPARITAVHKERYEAVCEHGPFHARLKGSVYYGNEPESYPTVGDFVLIQYNDSGDSLITGTLERRTFFSRPDPDPGRGEQAVAANFDYVFIMQSLNHDFNLRRLERYLTLAWQSGAQPVVVLTKADLADEYAAVLGTAQLHAQGAEVVAVSAKTGLGMDQLKQYLEPGKTIVFLGSSGVGKSSLVNALAGEDLMAVNDIREDDSRGRHTTTHRQLIMLDAGVMIIDTPGMRALGMGDISVGLDEAFADVEAYFDQCRFSDCRHETEPGCAIRIAMENGGLSAERWQSYLKLQKEARYDDNKTAALRVKHQRNKALSKEIKRMNKTTY